VAPDKPIGRKSLAKPVDFRGRPEEFESDEVARLPPRPHGRIDDAAVAPDKLIRRKSRAKPVDFRGKGGCAGGMRMSSVGAKKDLPDRL